MKYERRKRANYFWILVFIVTTNLLVHISTNMWATYTKVPRVRLGDKPLGYYIERDVAIFKLEGIVIAQIPLSDICHGYKPRKFKRQ